MVPGRTLTHGYAALLFPFVVLGLLVLESPERKSTVTTTITDDKIEWTNSSTADDALRVTEKQKKPNRPEPTAINPPPSTSKPSAGVAHP